MIETLGRVLSQPGPAAPLSTVILVSGRPHEEREIEL